MANKFTITINATITTDKEAAGLLADVYATVGTLGTNCIIQQVNSNQWVDQTNSKAQVFNADGTPRIEETQVANILEQRV